MAKKRGKRYTPKFKFDVVLEALSSGEQDAQVARRYGVHPVTLSNWKKIFLSNGQQVFSSKSNEAAQQKKINQLEQMLGRKEVELALARNFLKKP